MQALSFLQLELFQPYPANPVLIAMRTNSKPTLEDVARMARVSPATISRSINSPDKVATPTLERIEQAINTLGYTPHFGGKILASRRTNTVGAIIPTMANSLFASGLQAFQEVLAASGVRLLVASAGYHSDDELDQIRSLISHGADGLLLIGSSRPSSTENFLALRDIPYIISWSFRSDPSRLYAGFDNVKAAAALTREVLAHGHRQLGMIAGLTAGNDRARNRIEGVKSALREQHRDARLTCLVEADYTLEAGGDAFEQIMSASPDTTAVLCGNDVLAAGALTRARLMGISVPGHVSVTGFDDIYLASAVYPALTTVRIPHEEMGRTAARLLLKRLANEDQVSSVEFDTEVVLRDSLSAPRRAGSDV